MHLVAVMEREQRSPDGVEVLEHHPVLDDGVRFNDLVHVARGVEVDRTGVDPGIHSKQGHADPLEIAIGERPETPVRIAILGADAGVQHERADPGLFEYLGFQNHFAAGNKEVWPHGREEPPCLL